MHRFTIPILTLGCLTWLACDVTSILQPKREAASTEQAARRPVEGGYEDASTTEPAPATYSSEGQGYVAASYEEGEEAGMEPAAYEAEAAYEPARLNHIEGAVYIKGERDAEWTLADRNVPVEQGDSIWADEGGRMEMELSGGAMLRMAANARVDVVELAHPVLLKGYTGAFFVRVPAGYAESMTVEAPGASIELHGGSYLRVDIAEDGYTRYTVYAGEAEVASPEGRTTVAATNRFYVEPGYLPSDVEPVAEDTYDDFDSWARERDTSRPEPYESPSYRRVGRYVPGTSDLDASGEWVRIESREYYRPVVSGDWRPYSNGYWSYVQPYGYTWVSYDPFGYTTHHYGRWFHRTGYGWLWNPGYVWAPHHCHFASYGSNVLWAPLDPWGRPVYLGRSDYVIGGGINVDFRAWSYLPASGFAAGARNVAFVHRGIWGGAVDMRLVAAPHTMFRPHLVGRTPFTMMADGVRVHHKVLARETGLAKLPKPGLHFDKVLHGKSPVPSVKLHGPKAFKVSLPGSKKVAPGPPVMKPHAHMPKPSVAKGKPAPGIKEKPVPHAPKVSAPKVKGREHKERPAPHTAPAPRIEGKQKAKERKEPALHRQPAPAPKVESKGKEKERRTQPHERPAPAPRIEKREKERERAKPAPHSQPAPAPKVESRSKEKERRAQPHEKPAPAPRMESQPRKGAERKVERPASKHEVGERKQPKPAAPAPEARHERPKERPKMEAAPDKGKHEAQPAKEQGKKKKKVEDKDKEGSSDKGKGK